MNITELNAYKAMVIFLEQYYERTKSDDIGSLLGDLIMLNDGTTGDPAVWDEWIECLKNVIIE
ncbi:hypothetical protein [Paenibacillus apiarius]|uniref:Uncharacterized protein n=1 Tax=Paenibacillus apiarius TaxID=46240 RepID=A0ABT4E1G0_9BACL|nr:hypothetical protein [Paenibacillus apiarius]MCY9517149.1 hypothetical protein [Paenibacillus apiarius]MCY9523448.1 hypothetical protein [Paenibacillus apiarius]MCY9555084.1 hypothetical protein [Paenibacillus apiarius]MCY9561296.1 hypothetical protein [Paenibacillus apiarius]MCY9684588.1 hypothetical protein [Paenibacillus apiarius]